MLLTESSAEVAALLGPGAVAGAPLGAAIGALLVLRAIAHRVAALLALFNGGRLDLRANDVAHRLHPVGHDAPLLAVPLLDEDGAVALVVLAAHLDRVREALHAELLELRLGEVQVLEAPAHLLA